MIDRPTGSVDGDGFFRTAFDHAAVAMTALDQEGRWLRVNRSFCDLIGRSEAELRGLSMADITHPDDQAEGWAQVRRLLAGELSSYTLEKRYLHRDGSIIWGLLSVTAVLDEAGTPRFVLAQIQDITERKAAEEAWRQQERRAREAAELEHARLAELFGQAPAFMCTLRGPDHVFEFANPAYFRLVGFRDIIGKPVAEALPELREQGFIERLDHVWATGEPFVGRAFPVRLERSPGAPLEERFVTLVYQRLAATDPDRSGIFIHGTDVTEHVHATEALRDSEARFRAAFEQAAVGIMRVRPSDGRILRANQRLCNMLGYTAAELERHTFLDITHTDDRAEDARQVARLVAGELASFTLEKRYLAKNGEVVWAEVARSAVRAPDGSVQTIIAVANDITERKHAAEALRASDARYQRIAANVPGMVFQAVLSARGAFTLPFVSEGARRIYGRSPAEIERSPALLFDMVHLDDRPAFDAAAERSIADLEPWRWEGRVVLPSGEEKWLQGAARPERQIDGSTVWDGLLVDITEQRNLQAQLRQAQKMEAVGRLAGGIAHDFNNLLTAILSNAELVLGAMPDGPVREDVEVIRQAAERAAGLTRQLLAFSRKQVIQPKLLDLNAIMAETGRLLRPTLGERITLETDPGTIGTVLADPGQLEQVLVNLAVNARDAMPEGGTLTLRTRDVVVGEAFALRHRGLRPGTYVTLAVEDSGVGIPLELQSRVFEPFFTTKAVGAGTGLGLSTVYGIVKQWGGYVAVESAPGAGATFTIYLTRQDGAAQAEEARRETARLPTGKETVLVVEDETTVRSSIRRILARYGYTVLEARHGADALRVAEKAGQPIDLVMTDLVMPEMGGRELIGALRSWRADTKILVMSGYDEKAANRGEALPEGTHFLEKPFTVDGLLNSVRAALGTGDA